MRKKITWFITAFVLMLVGSFVWGRLRPASTAQAEALTQLQPATRPASERNAWPVYWLLDHDIPDNQLGAAYAQERRRLSDWAASIPPGADPTAVPEYVSPAAQAYPRLPWPDDAQRALLCGLADTDCLAKVRAQAPALRALLAQQQARLVRLRSISPGDALWDDTPATPYAPMPRFGRPESLQLSAAALDFVDNRRTQALAEVCRNVQVARGLHARTNSLIGAMVMISWTDAAERLFAAMLAELPAGEPLPEACPAAFAPVEMADVDLCAVMQREFVWVMGAAAAVAPARQHGWRRLRAALLTDMRGLRRLYAPHYAWACRTDVHAAMLADHRQSAASLPKTSPDVFDRVSNPFGSVLTSVGPPDFSSYVNRNLDHAAGLRVTGELLRAHQAGLAGEALRERLARELGMPSAGPRSHSFAPDSRHLRMSYYEPRQGRVELVLPIAP